MERAKILLDYKEYLLKVLNRSPLTIKNYLSSINLFLDFMDENDFNFLKFTFVRYQKFFDFLVNKKLSSESRKRHIAAINSFYDYLVLQNLVKENPIIIFKEGRSKNRAFEIFTKKEMKKICKKANNSKLNLQDKTLILTMLFTGLRTTEVVHLTKNNINIEQNMISTIGKNKAQRIIFIHPLLKDNLFSLYEQRDHFMFINKKNNHISERYLEYRIKELFVLLGIKEKVFPYKFRHSFATYLLNDTEDILFVKKIMGHANVKTTENYAHVYQNKLKRNVKDYQEKLKIIENK